MGLHELLIRTRLLFDDTARVLRACLPAAGADQAPRRRIELDTLEDRVHFDAAPIAAMAAETVGAAQLDEAAGTMAEAVDAQEAGGASEIEVVYLCDDGQQDATSKANGATAVGQASPDELDADIAANNEIRQAQPDLPFSLPQEDGASDLSRSHPSTLNSQQSVRHELAFVDPGVADFEELIDGLASDENRNIDVVMLDSQRDGIQQIREVLDGYTNLDAVHFVTHGTGGAVKLGATWLSMENLGGYSGDLAHWGWSLKADADLLFYGCDLADGEDGQALVDALSALTGADVAASTDDTGHELLGGDWEFEYLTGHIDTQIAVSNDVQQNWDGLLAVVNVTQTDDVVNAGDLSSVAGLIADDGGDGISLREAILATNADAGADEIILAAGTYTLSISGAGEDAAATGDLDIADDLTITGAGADVVTIDASMLPTSDRVFQVLSGTTTITGVAITGGSESNGGAIDTAGGSTLNLTDVAFSGNNASTNGGAIFMRSTSTLDGVTFENNTAGSGGGIYFSGAGAAVLTNVTFSGNSATNSGAIHNFNTDVTLINTTVVSNSSGIGGAGGLAVTKIQNSILDNLGVNSNFTLTSQGFNIDSNGTADGLVDGVNNDQVGTSASPIDPLLGSLQYNGGTTKTHALLGGSPAIDSGTAVGAPAVDQRGTVRDATPDIGAHEFTPSLIATLEFLVNTTTTDVQQTSAENRGSQGAVSLDADGNYVVVWSSLTQDGDGWGVYARRFDDTGTAITGEILVAQTSTDDQQWARVASDSAGNFVVVWASANQDTTTNSIYARRFDASGVALTNEFRVNTTATGVQKDPTIDMDGAGNFVVVWEGNGPGDADGIFARRFDANGTPLDASEFQVNATDNGLKENAAVAMKSNGDFVVAWNFGGDLFARMFDHTGTPTTGEIGVDAVSAAYRPDITYHESGNFTVAWRSNSIVPGIYTRRYDSAGNPLTGTTRIAGSSHTDPSIATDLASNYIVVWEGPGDGNGVGVFAEKFDATGNSLGATFQVNQTTDLDQHMASVAMIDTDNFVVVWSGNGDQAGHVDSSGVFARQYGTASPTTSEC